MQSQNNQKLLDLKNAEVKFSVERGIVNAVNDLSLLFEYLSDLSKTLIYANDSGSFKGLE